MLHLCTVHQTRALWPRVFHVVHEAIHIIKRQCNAAFTVVLRVMATWAGYFVSNEVNR